MVTTYPQAVSAWAEHLRHGGTTPWADFAAGAPPAAPLHPLPDAIHLELVRRINSRGVVGTGTPRLVDLVLATAAPGRGLLDVPLPWPEAPRFGTPPIEPGSVPDEELIRLAVGVLARLLPGVPTPPTAPDLVRWPVPWRRRFRLYGSPLTVAAVRGHLLRRGLVESDWRPVHLVLGRPLEVMMAEHWAATSAAGAHLQWVRLWRRAEALDALPRGLDVVAAAERLSRPVRAGRSRRVEPVHLVVAETLDEVAALVAETLGVRPDGIDGTAAGTDPARTDLLRRLNRLTTVTHGPGHVRRLSARLDHVLAQVLPDAGAATGPTVPEGAADWARATTDAAVRRTARAGYAVHGDPQALAPSRNGLPGTVDRRRTLEVAVEACLRTWRLQEGSP